MFTACFGKERQYGFLGKQLVTNLFSIFSNNRLNFHEGGEISNQEDLSRENVGSLKENSFGTIKNRQRHRHTHNWSLKSSKCSFLCPLLRSPMLSTRRKYYQSHSSWRTHPTRPLPGSGASPTLTLRQDIIHPFPGKAYIFVSNLLSKLSRHQTNNFFMIL